MGLDGDLSFLGTSFQVFLIDLLLSGDNAVVIALVCRSLPPRQTRTAILFGTVVAVIVRVYLTTVVSYLLDIPCLKLVGAGALLLIAIKLMVDEGDEQQPNRRDHGLPSPGQDLWVAVVLIVIADLVMSLDNVVALAAAARGSMLFLSLGLLFSIPLLMYGSLFVAALLKRYPELISVGGALLGWLAGDIGVSDPILADWVNTQAPALVFAMPVLAAVFVILESRIVAADRRVMRPMALALASPMTATPEPPEPEAKPSGEDAVISALVRMAGRRPSRRKRAEPSDPKPPAYRQPSIEEALAANALILVADDNPIELGALKRALEHLGYAVETANDGRQALEMLGRRHYGLLIADYDMPKMDGYALAAEVRSQDHPTERHLPIIGLLGYLSADAIKQRCFDAGMDDCVSKGAPSDALDAVVSAFLPAADALRRQTPTVLEG